MKKIFALMVLGAAFAATNPVLAQTSATSNASYLSSASGQNARILADACEVFNTEFGEEYCFLQLCQAEKSGALTIEAVEGGDAFRVSYGGNIVIVSIEDFD